MKDIFITFYTQFTSFQVRMESESPLDTDGFMDMLKDAFKRKEIIEFEDYKQRTHIIRTADLVGYKIEDAETVNMSLTVGGK